MLWAARTCHSCQLGNSKRQALLTAPGPAWVWAPTSLLTPLTTSTVTYG